MSHSTLKGSLLLAMRRLHIICLLVGLAPYALNKNGRLRMNRQGTVQTVLAIAMQIVLLYYVAEFGSTALWARNNILVLVKHLQIQSRRVLTFLYIIVEYRNRNNLVDIINQLQEFDDIASSSLDNYNMKINYGVDTYFVWKRLPFIIVPVYIDIYFSEWHVKDLDNLQFIYNTLLYLAFGSTTPMCIIKFLMLNNFIAERFSGLNRFLEERTIRNSDVSLVLDTKTDEQLHALRLSCQLHTKLCKISKQLNSAYNIQIILYVTLTFVVVVTQLYYVALGFIDPHNEHRTIAEIIMSLNWANYHIMGVVALAVSCHKASKEAARTGVLLHRMRNRHQSRVKEVIETWSLQLLHQKLGFTAGGLFNIDMTLVYSIIGSITTYLVILIQFNMAGSQRKAPLFDSPINETAVEVS